MGVGEVKFSGMVLPTMKKRRIYRRAEAGDPARNLTLGIGDGWLKADGETIYTAKDLRVGLFQAGEAAACGV